MPARSSSDSCWILRWWRSDSLWQAHDARYTADQVCIIPGTQAVAGITRLNLQGNAEQQAEEIRAAMSRLFPEAVALVREAREGFGT